MKKIASKKEIEFKSQLIGVRLLDINAQALREEARARGYENLSSYVRNLIRLGRAAQGNRRRG